MSRLLWSSATNPAPILLLLSTAAIATLSGCGIGIPSTGPAAGTAVRGKIMGGQQPISGSTIQAYSVSNTGYGTASTPLLFPAATSDPGGNFNVTTPYTCPTPTTPVYMVASGGNPGITGPVNNTAIQLIAALGPCGNISSSTHVIINEATTVAAVWALGPFMTAYDHVGTSATNPGGITNAFAMAANLVSVDRGQSPGDAPTGATIPTPEIYSLANILATCVNTDGTNNPTTPCGKLFAQAALAGGTTVTDTVGAALEIATHPGTNVSGTYTLPPGLAPFQPTLGSAPNDWTIAISLALGGISGTTHSIALDATGNMWIQDGKLKELSPSGALLGSYSAMAGLQVAIDATGNIWADTGAATFSKMPPTLGPPTTYPATAITSSNQIAYFALDGTGNVWYTCGICSETAEMSNTGTPLASIAFGNNHTAQFVAAPDGSVWAGSQDAGPTVLTSSGGTISTTTHNCGGCGDVTITFDGSGAAWLAGGGDGKVTKMTSTGSYTSAGYPTTLGGLNSPRGIAIDGAGNAWVVNSTNLAFPSPYAGALTELTNSMTAVTPVLGYVSTTLATPYYDAIDGSGNVWLSNSTNDTLTVFVGLATPAVTPLTLALANGTVGTKP